MIIVIIIALPEKKILLSLQSLYILRSQDPHHQHIVRYTARNADEDVAANRRCLLAAGARGKTARGKEDPGCGCRLCTVTLTNDEPSD